MKKIAIRTFLYRDINKYNKNSDIKKRGREKLVFPVAEILKPQGVKNICSEAERAHIFVIGLGGSIVVQEQINVEFLKKFKQVVLSQIKQGSRFLIIMGGGKLARDYQKAAGDVANAPAIVKDWLGIEATKLNGLLIKAIFGKYAQPVLLDEPGKIKQFGKYKIIVGCGWWPGRSTDFVAIKAANDFKIKEAIIIGKPDFVYSANPDKDKTAQPISKMSWGDYFKLIPKKWTPGLNSPVDPEAAKLARKQKMKVIVAGKSLSNLANILASKPFNGTMIE